MISLKRVLSALAMGAAALLAGPAAAQQSLNLTPLSIEALATHPAITGVVMSPDGTHVAGLVNSPSHRWPVIAIWNVEDLTQPPVWIPSTEMRPRSVTFLGNRRVLFFVDQPFTYGSTRTFTVQAVVADIDGRNFEQPFAARGALADTARDAERYGYDFEVLLDGTMADPNRYIIQRTNIELGSTEVLALDADTLRVERVARAGDDQQYILADVRDGRLMIRQGLRFENGGWQVVREVRNRSNNNWEEHPELGFSIRDRTNITPIGFYDTDPNKLYVSSNKGQDLSAIRVYDIATRQWEPEAAFASPEFEIASVSAARDQESSELRGVGSYTIEGPSRHQVFVDDYWAPIQRTLESQFSNTQISITSRNRRLGRAIVTVSAPNRPPEYYILLDGAQLRLLGRSRPQIDNATLGNTTFIRYQARDGLTIPAFLTLPPNYDPAVHGRIPVVVHPHGGPWARDYLGWDSSGWTQFMATRGYAVIQPQYRGSEGWGAALWKAGDQEWGQKMSDDNDDAAAYLVAQGIGDPDRMAIFGYSYGGFAAIAASVRPNSPYQCALSGAGVSDLQRLANLWGANRIQRESQGWTVTGMNPIQNVRDANIPILLYHGSHDRQADTVHSRDFYRSMRNAGKTVEYHEIDSMWHQLPWWPEWHRESLGYIESWLAGPNCFGGAQSASN